MKIENCIFPDDLLYDTENFTWVDVTTTKVAKIGISMLLCSISGKLTAIKIKDVGTEIERGKNFASIESNKYFGVVRAPFTGKIIEVNESICKKPKLVNDFPYSDGWFVKMEPFSIHEYQDNLQSIRNCLGRVKAIIKDLHIRCFIAYPDYEMYEIGIECAATLAKLNELVSGIGVGEIIHLVSDDKTADLEMMRWSEENGQSILESRREGNLLHFIIKKTR